MSATASSREVAHRNVDVLENRSGSRIGRRCHNACGGPTDILITKCGRDATQCSDDQSTGNIIGSITSLVPYDPLATLSLSTVAHHSGALDNAPPFRASSHCPSTAMRSCSGAASNQS